MRYVVGRDALGRVIDVPISGTTGTVDDGTAEHPDLVEHVSLGLAADGHSHVAGDHPDLAAHTTLGLAATHAHDYSTTGHTHAYAAQSHAHAESDVTDLVTDLSGKASTGHNHDVAYSAAGHGHVHDHDADYSATDHVHAGGDHPDLAAHDTLGLATQAELDAHTHPGGSEAFPVGAVFLSVVTTSPATLLGYGTWAAFGAGRMLVGFDSGQAGFDTDEETGGAATHGHTFTQPADHAALTHSGTAVANHAFTQPNAHTDVPTHTHTTDSPGAHVHDEYRNGATTGGLDGWGAGDTSTNNPTLTGYDTGSAGGHTHTAAAPAGAVASQPHTGGAVDAHGVTQPSQHAAQSHASGAVADGSTFPPYITVHMWKRTA